MSKADIDKLIQISPQFLEEQVRKTEKSLHFSGLAGIRMTVGFLVGAGAEALSFVGSVFVGS